jgi:hypothetical protein
MTPPIFNDTAEVAEFLAQHDKFGHFLVIHQYCRFIEFLHQWSDGGTSLPALMMEFFRREIERLDRINNGD